MKFHLKIKLKIMKKLEFSTDINASKEKVWDALWKDENYEEWTKSFA